MWARITRDPLDPASLMERVAGPENGAILLFAGVVRNHVEGRPVSGMGYEAYEDMARDVLEEIVGEEEARHEVSSVAASHRIGDLGSGLRGLPLRHRRDQASPSGVEARALPGRVQPVGGGNASHSGPGGVPGGRGGGPGG